jgi:hypothetical protein
MIATKRPRGPAVNERMPSPIRTIVPALLFAFSATSVDASPKAAPATGAGTAPPSTPVELAARSAAPRPTAPLDLTLPPAAAAPAAPLASALLPAVAAPAAPVDPLQAASAQVKEVVSWITGSGDNTRLPFLVIDKPSARVFAFDPSGQFQGDAPVLLGMGLGDVMLAPSATMSQMPPHTRITPAGRFVSKLAKDAKGKELLVLDYKAAFSLHPVVPGKPHERRAERLGSVTSQDNRISFGCINVPVPFYKTVISPAFASTHGIVYILPETSQASAFFRYTPPGSSPVGTLASGPQQATPATPAPNAPAGQTVPEAAAK